MAIAPILSWEGLGLIQGSGWLFQDLDINIAPRDRLALIGLVLRTEFVKKA